jgi:hypothetical protein
MFSLIPLLFLEFSKECRLIKGTVTAPTASLFKVVEMHGASELDAGAEPGQVSRGIDQDPSPSWIDCIATQTAAPCETGASGLWR